MDNKLQEKFYKIIGTKIINFRKENKMSQVTFATKVNLSRSSIVNIELGRQHTPPHVLWEIALALAIPVESLFPSQQELNNFIDDPTLHEVVKRSVTTNEKQQNLYNFLNHIKEESE